MVDPRLLRLSQPPADGEVLSTTHPQRLVALAEDVGDLVRSRAFLQGLVMGGHDVLAVWARGDWPRRLSFLPDRIQVHPGQPGPEGFAGSVSADAQVQAALAAADALVPFGSTARTVAEAVAGRRCPVAPHADLAGWSYLSRTWEQLAARADAGRLHAGYARHLTQLVGLLDGTVPDEAQAPLGELLEHLLRTGEHEVAAPLVPLLDLQVGDPSLVARRRAVLAHLRTSLSGREDPDLRAAAGSALAAADAHLAAGEVPAAARLTTLALGLLFHVELHAAGSGSPLVEDPDGFLASWRASTVGQVLAGPVPRRSYDPGARGGVVAVPGSYPRFAAPVVAALLEHADVEVVDLADDGHLRGLGVRGELVEWRLRLALGQEVPPPWGSTEALDRATALFVDWADRGALVALTGLASGVRTTLRIHSMDALSPWVHLVDWTAVDELVLVSEHLRDLVARLLGDRLSGTRVHVVPNVVDTSRITTVKDEGHRRRLLMIGWAQRVKDPVWALEVLGRLRQEDPDWRLLLVGPDLAPGTVRSAIDHARSFRHRLTEPDVCGAVEFVGESERLAPHLASSGFVLSTSHRESFGLGLVEGAASGAVPVVRNWPIFAPLDGARRLFPDEWVVDTVEEAVARIRTHQDEPAWSGASTRARETVAERFITGSPEQELARIVLGRADDEPS
ncbi:MAG TPA: glycosyltransferase family 4 protein [Ornithinimicrobium sp.]|nr:glycosyltransferase family 4 protein [Ornithinimicrobium sp.]